MNILELQTLAINVITTGVFTGFFIGMILIFFGKK